MGFYKSYTWHLTSFVTDNNIQFDVKWRHQRTKVLTSLRSREWSVHCKTIERERGLRKREKQREEADTIAIWGCERNLSQAKSRQHPEDGPPPPLPPPFAGTVHRPQRSRHGLCRPSSRIPDRDRRVLDLPLPLFHAGDSFSPRPRGAAPPREIN